MKFIKNALKNNNDDFKNLLRLNLQHFSEGGEGGDDPKDPPADPPKDEKVELTAEELQKRIESESDRKLAKALEKKQKEWEQQQEKAIKEALEKHERLSKLSEKERKEEELTQKEKELAEKEAEIARKILRSEAVEDLQEKGLPANFADFLLAEDAEKTLENINNFKKAFDEAVNAAVKERLRQDTPPAGGRISGGKIPSVAELAKEARIIK